MIWVAVLAVGFVIGLAVGRWWALAPAAGLAAWIWATTDVEIPHWLLALLYGGVAAIGISAGVTVRKRA
jgi:hypothetical protein